MQKLKGPVNLFYLVCTNTLFQEDDLFLGRGSGHRLNPPTVGRGHPYHPHAQPLRDSRLLDAIYCSPQFSDLVSLSLRFVIWQCEQ